MKPDDESYLRRLIADYERFEQAKLKRFIERTGTRTLDAPEKFLELRKAVRFKPKAGPSAAGPKAADERPEPEAVREVLPALQILNDPQHPKTLLLAEPGMGKTALFWVMARRDAEAFLMAPSSQAPLPLRFDLRACQKKWDDKSKDNLIRLLGESLAEMGLFPATADPIESFRELGSRQKLRLLLDGLNEVEGARRDDLVDDIESLARELDQTRGHFLAVSSRVREGAARINEFTRADLEPLSPSEVEDYAHEVLGEKAKDFLDQVKNKRLERLAAIPLFLRFIAELHLSPGVQEIPPNRGLVLQKVLEIGFLVRHEKEAVDQSAALCGEDCLGLAARLAHTALLAGRGVELNREDIRSAYDAWRQKDPDRAGARLADDEVIDSLVAHGVIAPDKIEPYSEDAFGFWHPVFRDYFAGVRIAELWKNLTTRRDREAFLRPLLTFTRNDEALSIAMGLLDLPHSQPLLDSVLSLHLFAAAKLYADNQAGVGRDAKKPDADSLFKALAKRLKVSVGKWYGKNRIVDAWAEIGNSLAQDVLIEAMADAKLDGWVRTEATTALGKIGSAEAQKVLIAALADETLDDGVRAHAAYALGEIGSPKSQRALIAAMADETLDGWVRLCATFALGDMGTPEAEGALLVALADNKSGPLLGSLVVSILAKIRSPKAQRALIAALANEGLDFKVRAATANALGKIGSSKAQAALISILTNETLDSFIREQVAFSLGHNSSPKAERTLIATLEDEKLDNGVRRNAALALVPT